MDELDDPDTLKALDELKQAIERRSAMFRAATEEARQDLERIEAETAERLANVERLQLERWWHAPFVA